jgi:hypothetical protein
MPSTLALPAGRGILQSAGAKSLKHCWSTKMRVATDDNAEMECNQVTVSCRVRTAGLLPVGEVPPTEVFLGDHLVVIVDEVRNQDYEDNTVTLRLEKPSGMVISRQINLTALFRLVRENTPTQE